LTTDDISCFLAVHAFFHRLLSFAPSTALRASVLSGQAFSGLEMYTHRVWEFPRAKPQHIAIRLFTRVLTGKFNREHYILSFLPRALWLPAIASNPK